MTTTAHRPYRADSLDVDLPRELREAFGFVLGFTKTMVEPARDRVLAAWPAAEAAFAAATGRPPTTIDDVRAVLATIPDYATEWALYNTITAQRWAVLKALTDHNHDRIEAQLDSVPAQGVGSLRLDPAFTLPDYYAPHQIHLVPGSFHSNHIYALMTDMPDGPRTLSKDDAWEGARREVLDAVPPGDYRVIVDLATGLGRAAVVLAEQYPSASVTAIDLSAPQLRYGHWFAERRGLAIDFVQEDIRRTSVATGSADLVVMLAAQHEQPPAAMRAILAEVARMLRPGGVFVNIDIVPNRQMPPFMRYWFGRHVETGSEPYWLVAGDLDLPAEFAAVGLVAVTERGPGKPLGLTGPHYPWTTIGRKPAAR